MNDGNAERTTAATAASTVAQRRPRRGAVFTSESPAVYTFVRFAASVWTTIAARRTTSTSSLEVSWLTATNGFVSPLAAAAYPPTNVVTTAERSAEETSPICMSARDGL